MASEPQSAGALDRYMAEYEHDPDFVAESTALDVTEQAVRLMQEKGLTQAALATRMGVSPAFVSRIFNAPANLTLRSIAKLALALDAELAVQLTASPPRAQAEPRRDEILPPRRLLRARQRLRVR